MKTEVIMYRELFGGEVKQKSHSEYFSATDLVNLGNRWRIENKKAIFNLSTWLKKESTQEFISALETEYGEVVTKGKGRLSQTWVHPFIFIDIALAINPTLKISVYKWLYDHLLKYRNTSGDSYKKMVGALYNKSSDKQRFQKVIQDVAIKIKKAMGVEDWNKATESQLNKRDKIHEAVAMLSNVMTDTDKILEIAFTEILAAKG